MEVVFVVTHIMYNKYRYMVLFFVNKFSPSPLVCGKVKDHIYLNGIGSVSLVCGWTMVCNVNMIFNCVVNWTNWNVFFDLCCGKHL